MMETINELDLLKEEVKETNSILHSNTDIINKKILDFKKEYLKQQQSILYAKKKFLLYLLIHIIVCLMIALFSLVIFDATNNCRQVLVTILLCLYYWLAAFGIHINYYFKEAEKINKNMADKIFGLKEDK